MIEPGMLDDGDATSESPGEQDLGEARASADEDSLLAALQAQMLENRVETSRQWKERLRQLAEATEQSRRYATVIFADLCGYTRLTNVLEETELKRLRQWFYQLAANAIDRYGGFLIQLEGDGVFAAFGAPWAFERDTESAVRCLLSIRKEVLAQKTFEGEPLEVSGGAAAGVINVDVVDEGGRIRPDLMGPAVNLAARMEAKAEAGQILVPEDVARQLEGTFEMQELPPFEPKNFNRLITPYLIVREQDDGAALRKHPPFVGRTAELIQLGKIFRRAESGAFTALRMIGDAGIGKTRLLLEALKQIPAEYTVFHLELRPDQQHLLLEPVRLLLRRIAGLEEEGKAPAELAARIGERCGELEPAEEQVLRFILQDPEAQSAARGLHPAQLRTAIETAVIGTLEKLSRAQPVMIAIDNYQWCDPMTAEIMGRLLDLKPPSLCLVTIGRSGERTENEEQAWQLFTVTALREEETPLLLRELLDPEKLHPLLRQKLMESAGGAPLYLIELAEELSELQHLSPGEMMERLRNEESLEGSRKLIDIFQARIDRLTNRQRTILQCGAVMGPRFRESLLGAYREISERLMEEIALLRSARLLKDYELTGDREYEFLPLALRDVAYDMLPKEKRAELHGVFAGLIEEKFADRKNDFAHDLAEHWLRAGKADRARSYLRKACLQYQKLGAPQEAYQLALRALNTSTPASEKSSSQLRVSRQREALLREQAARAALILGDVNESIEHSTAWREIAEEIDHANWMAEADLLRADALFKQGDIVNTRNLAEDLCRRDGIKWLLRLKSQFMIANCDLRQGNLEQAEETYREIAVSDALGNSAMAGDCWSSAGLCAQRLGRLEDALSYLQKSVDAYGRASSPLGQCIALNNQAIIQEKLGEFEKAESALRETLRKAESIGYLLAMTGLNANLANVELLLGRYQAAEQSANRALYFGEMIHDDHSIGIAKINLGLSRFWQGFEEQAEKLLAEAVSCGLSGGNAELTTEAHLERLWIAGWLNESRADDFLQEVSALNLSSNLEPFRETVLAFLKSLASGKLAGSFLNETLTKPDRIRRLELGILASQRTGEDATPLIGLLAELRAGR